MPILKNKYLENLNDCVGNDDYFCGDYVQQVTTASRKLFDNMRQKSGVKSADDLRACNWNKSSITKAELIDWLETAVYLLDSVSLPLLSLTTEQKEELDILKNEKIGDQRKIIELQENLIKEKDVKINTVQKTVETELKSYSSILQKSCTAAFAPSKLAAAVKTVRGKTTEAKML